MVLERMVYLSPRNIQFPAKSLLYFWSHYSLQSPAHLSDCCHMSVTRVWPGSTGAHIRALSSDTVTVAISPSAAAIIVLQQIKYFIKLQINSQSVCQSAKLCQPTKKKKNWGNWIQYSKNIPNNNVTYIGIGIGLKIVQCPIILI